MNYFNFPTNINADNISNVFILLYLIAAGGIGIFSLVALAILRKHAQRPGVATGVATVYIILFALVFLLSLTNLISLFNA